MMQKMALRVFQTATPAATRYCYFSETVNALNSPKGRTSLPYTDLKHIFWYKNEWRYFLSFSYRNGATPWWTMISTISCRGWTKSSGASSPAGSCEKRLSIGGRRWWGNAYNKVRNRDLFYRRVAGNVFSGRNHSVNLLSQNISMLE